MLSLVVGLLMSVFVARVLLAVLGACEYLLWGEEGMLGFWYEWREAERIRKIRGE